VPRLWHLLLRRYCWPVADRRREIEQTAEELAYAAVGFAVLGFQRVQVARRQLEKTEPFNTINSTVNAQMRQACSTLSGLVKRVRP